jgi:hypothetical protein
MLPRFSREKSEKQKTVPLYSVREAPISISNNKTVVITPLSLVTITCHMTQKKGNGIPLKTKRFHRFSH